jgi:folate-binding protein YgfZ
MPGRLALHDAHVAAGATVEPVCGWQMPLAYGDAAAEYRAVREGVGLIDLGARGVLEVTGRDRARFLHALLTNDVAPLAPGQGRSAALLDAHGKVQAVVAVWVVVDRIQHVTPPGAATTALELLDRYLFAERVELRDASDETARLLLAGPGAPALAERLTGATPPAEAWAATSATLAGEPVRVVSGAGETGEREVWLVTPATAGPRAWEAARAAGARPVGLVAQESLRIEAGTPSFGHDVDGSVLLPEIPCAHLVSHTKGCYPGQEVVVRIRDRGHVNRLLRGLVLEGAEVPAPGAPVEVDGATVGRVTSATRSIGLGRPVALAFVRRAHGPGARVAVRVQEQAAPATVTDLPIPR